MIAVRVRLWYSASQRRPSSHSIHWEEMSEKGRGVFFNVCIFLEFPSPPVPRPLLSSCCFSPCDGVSHLECVCVNTCPGLPLRPIQCDSSPPPPAFQSVEEIQEKNRYKPCFHITSLPVTCRLSQPFCASCFDCRLCFLISGHLSIFLSLLTAPPFQ